MNSDPEIDEFIAQDRKANPSCNYSYSNKKRCQSVNGKSVCEVLNQVTRMCPGKAPIQIYSNTSKEDSDAGDFSSSSGSGQPGMFSLFDDILKEFSRPGLPPGFHGTPRNRDDFPYDDDDIGEPRFAPPERDHRRGFGGFGGGLFGSTPNSSKKKNSIPPIEGEVSGPIEKI